MFIGRESELATLEKAYQKDAFQFIILYGRRRVGKTRLMAEFSKGRNVVFFSAEENNDKLNLAKFSEVLLSHFGESDMFPSFANWEQSFRYAGQKSRNARLMIVLDELPYLVQGNPSFLSILQNRIDHEWMDTKLFLIACGSSVSFMENEVLAHKSPIFGRKTGQLQVLPFDYLDASRFFPNWSNQEKMMVYGILGGTPQYLLQFSPERTIEDNIKEYMLDTASYLYDEPKSLMRQELRNPSVYNGIVEAIALGASKPNEVAAKIGENPTKAAKYLLTLQKLRIIAKDFPAGDIPEVSRKAKYRLSDPLFSFVYRFVYRNRSMAEQGLTDDLYAMKIKPELMPYMGKVFESVCIQFLVRQNRMHRLPLVVESFQSWWGGNPETRRQEEIDIVGISGDSALYGECKYRNDWVGMEVLDKLILRSSCIPRNRRIFVLFSKIGFSDALLARANIDENLLLFTLDDLYAL